MKKIFSVSLLILLLIIPFSGCLGNDKASYSPLNFPDSVWKAEEIDMFFKVTEFSNEKANYFTLGKFNKEEKEYAVSVCFGLGRKLSVEFVDVEAANTFADDSKCVLAKGNCIFQENKLTVKLQKNKTFGNINKIVFKKQDTSDLQDDFVFKDTNNDICPIKNKSNWICNYPYISFAANQNNDICYQGNMVFKDKTIDIAIIFGFQSKIYILDLSKYEKFSDRFNATVIGGNYEYVGNELIIHIEKNIIDDSLNTIIFKESVPSTDHGGDNSTPDANVA